MGPAPSASRRRSGLATPPTPYGASPRASHAERDAFVEQLKVAYAEGRLDDGEFDRRVHLALTASTHADLWALLADLPSHPPAQQWVSPPVPARPSWAERGWAVLGHLCGFMTSFIGPLVLAYTTGRRSAFVRHQALEAAQAQLSFLAFNILLVPATVATLGIGALLYIPLWVGWLTLPWLASLVALAGERFRYPFVFRFLR
jgi:uncharacterized Tic20 family protein